MTVPSEAQPAGEGEHRRVIGEGVAVPERAARRIASVPMPIRCHRSVTTTAITRAWRRSASGA
jgi:hypothetical protein